MYRPVSAPPSVTSVSGPIGLSITACVLSAAVVLVGRARVVIVLPFLSYPSWPAGLTVKPRRRGAGKPAPTSSASGGRQAVNRVVRRSPQVLHGVAAPGSPRLGPLGQGGGGARQAERPGRLAHAEVGSREGVGVTEAPHRDHLGRPGTQAGHGREL